MKRRILSLLLTFLLATGLFAQTDANGQAEMADLMSSNGKIYVVVAVILTILLGLVLYLVRIDRKISRLEKEK
ncbi:MAG: CcmD family protein [Sphingobacteriales bacterium 12-47-4]|nr:MAG: CcmD family protein [Sphingobacteriales bacterium 12-47-4]